MKAIDEFAAVRVFAALIAGACVGRTMLPVAPDARGAIRSAPYPGDGMGQTIEQVQGAAMKLNLNEVPHLSVLIGSVALILLGMAGTATVMAWVPYAGDVENLGEALDSVPPPVRPVGVEEQISAGQARRARSARRQCEECGVVASTREIRQHREGSEFGAAGGVTRAGRSELSDEPTRIYEVTIRMQDGSNRVVVQASPVNWRVGERLIFIAGLTQASH